MGHIISISGDLASGKTSTATGLCRKLGYKLISCGDMHRGAAHELGMTTLESNVYAETNPWIDNAVDSALMALIADGSDCVIESRTAWHLLKSSFKIYLRVDPDVGAARAMSDTQRRNELRCSDQEHAKSQLLARKASENRRFLAEYGIDCSDLRNYDVVLDTTHLRPEHVIERLFIAFVTWRDETC